MQSQNRAIVEQVNHTQNRLELLHKKHPTQIDKKDVFAHVASALGNLAAHHSQCFTPPAASQDDVDQNLDFLIAVHSLPTTDLIPLPLEIAPPPDRFNEWIQLIDPILPSPVQICNELTRIHLQQVNRIGVQVQNEITIPLSFLSKPVDFSKPSKRCTSLLKSQYISQLQWKAIECDGEQYLAALFIIHAHVHSRYHFTLIYIPFSAPFTFRSICTCVVGYDSFDFDSILILKG